MTSFIIYCKTIREGSVIKVFKGWLDRYLSDPDVILLLVWILATLAVVLMLGHILMPVFISVAIVILLQFWVNLLQKHKISRTVSFWIVYITFVTLFFGSIFFLFPLLWRQGVSLVTEMPVLLQNGKNAFTAFIHSKQDYISQQYLDSISTNILAQSQDLGKRVVTLSLATIPGLITIAVYLVLVPLLVFFFLRDNLQIVAWIKRFIPQNRGIIGKVWLEMNQQMGNYIRGKIYEILIVFVFTYIVFLFFGLKYQMLLASIVALSVIIPYVGVVIVTIPVALIGYFQWGFAGGVTGEFALMLYSYVFVQFVDGNIIVPLLFSETMNLHPIAIIVAILFFGSLWGFWGVFFAIPLATLVKAVINAWPKQKDELQQTV